jgi:DNA repair protein RadC
MGVHDGHRNRMRKRFLKNGLKSFEEHEMLEMLLFYSIPRKNTNEIAHNLINRFGSLKETFDANIDVLTQVDGITENSAVLLKMIPQLCNAYINSNSNALRITSMEDIKDLAIKKYISETKEILRIVLMDSDCNYLDCVEICTNNSENILDIDIKKIIQEANEHDSTHIIIMHNHPKGIL